jgi:hypothetical protein
MIASNGSAIHSISLSIKYSGNPDYAPCLGIAVPKKPDSPLPFHTLFEQIFCGKSASTSPDHAQA